MAYSRFGEEHWLQKDESGRLEVRRQPHNAFMIFFANIAGAELFDSHHRVDDRAR